MIHKQKSSVLLTLILSILSNPAFAKDVHDPISYRAVPGAIYLEGPGPLVGLGLGVENIYKGRVNVMVAKTLGNNSGTGFVINDIPFFSDNLSLTTFVASLDKGQFLNSYTRGLTSDSRVLQKGSGNGSGLIMNYKRPENKILINFGLMQSTINLDGYENTDNSSEILLPSAFLAPVKTSSLFVNFNFDSNRQAENENDNWQWQSKLGIKADTGRIGQADQLVTSLQFSGDYVLKPYLSLNGRIQSSDSFIISRQEKYESSDGVLSELKIDCSSLSGTQESDCSELRDQLANFIAKNNKYGSADAIGGSRGLRGFRELRFKAAHTRLASIESRLKISHWLPGEFFSRKSNHLAIVPFYDWGFASDNESKVFDSSEYSSGISLRLQAGELSLRLTAAKSRNDNIAFFTVGKPW